MITKSLLFSFILGFAINSADNSYNGQNALAFSSCITINSLIASAEEERGMDKPISDSLEINQSFESLVGFWSNDGPFGAGAAAGERYIFYEDGTFTFKSSERDCTNRKISFYGTWTVGRNNNLRLSANREKVIVGGEYLPAEAPLDYGYEIVGGEVVERPISPIRTHEFPLIIKKDTLWHSPQLFIMETIVLGKSFHRIYSQ